MATVEPQATEPRALNEETLCGAFQVTAAERPDAVAVRTPGGGVEWTFAHLADRVRRTAAGLAALGVQPGETVGVLLANRPEVHLADLAAVHIGAVPFALYAASSPAEVAEAIRGTGSRVVVTEHAFLSAVANAGVEHTVLVDGGAEGAMPLAQLEELAEPGFDFDAAWRAVRPDDVLTLLLTAGATGPPRAAEIPHRAMQAVNRAFSQAVPATAGGRTTSFLPSAHPLDRWSVHYLGLCCYGMTVTCVADPRAILAALPEARPTAWASVPAVYERIRAGLEAQGITDPRTLAPHVKAGVRAKLGLDQCEWLLAGGAAMALPALEFFSALGLPVLALYGTAETAGLTTVEPPESSRMGTVGKPLAGVELKLAEDREILVRGPNVMRGYRGDPDRTAAALDADGWLHTGDLGELRPDGYLRVLARKGELIVDRAGNAISPEKIEAAIAGAHPLVGHAFVVGDGRPCNVALIVLDRDVARSIGEKLLLLQQPTTAAVAAHPEVRRMIHAAVEEANRTLAPAERVQRFAVLDDEWRPGGPHVTPTSALRRAAVARAYAADIATLYADAEPATASGPGASRPARPR
jgi:long-chain acyl-CoA synthetase